MSEHPPTNHVEQRDKVMQIKLAVPMDIKPQIEQMAEESEYSDWKYNHRTYYNTPVGELILRDMILPSLEAEGGE